MQEYDVIAPFYDVEHGGFDEDLDMYSNFAELCGGKVLELACGSGRVLLPLAREGFELVGVDTSAGMLEIARRRLESEDLIQRCSLVQQDIRALKLEQRFRMAFIALGSFGHITTRSEQLQTLAAVRAHLGGRASFVVDLGNADARYMETMSGQVLHQGTWQDEQGEFFTHWVSPAASNRQHLLEMTHFYERYPQGGPVHRTTVTTMLYLFERYEFEFLLEQTGFAVKGVYGDYELTPYQLDSPRLIFLAEAR